MNGEDPGRINRKEKFKRGRNSAAFGLASAAATVLGVSALGGGMLFDFCIPAIDNSRAANVPANPLKET